MAKGDPVVDYSEEWKKLHAKQLAELEKQYPDIAKKKRTKIIISATGHIENAIAKAHSKKQ